MSHYEPELLSEFVLGVSLMVQQEMSLFSPRSFLEKSRSFQSVVNQ